MISLEIFKKYWKIASYLLFANIKLFISINNLLPTKVIGEIFKDVSFLNILLR